VGVVINQNDAEKILEEVQAHPKELKETISTLMNTFMKNNSK